MSHVMSSVLLSLFPLRAFPLSSPSQWFFLALKLVLVVVSEILRCGRAQPNFSRTNHSRRFAPHGLFLGPTHQTTIVNINNSPAHPPTPRQYKFSIF